MDKKPSNVIMFGCSSMNLNVEYNNNRQEKIIEQPTETKDYEKELSENEIKKISEEIKESVKSDQILKLPGKIESEPQKETKEEKHERKRLENERRKNASSGNLVEVSQKKSFNIKDKSNYITRDVSWLQFNYRLLMLASDSNIPLLERFNYLSITSTNMDEFNIVRVPRYFTNENEIEINGKTRLENYKDLVSIFDPFIDKQNNIMVNLLKELRSLTGITYVDETNITKEEKKYCKKYFKNKIQSYLTPMTVDVTRPFPMIENGQLYSIIVCKDIDYDGKKIMSFTISHIPDLFDRVIKLSDNRFILLEKLVDLCIPMMFSNKEIYASGTFRMLRNASGLETDSETYIVKSMKQALSKRSNGNIVRIDYSGKKSKLIKGIMQYHFAFKKQAFKKHIFTDLKFGFDIIKLLTKEQIEKLSYPSFKPVISPDLAMESSIIKKVLDEDIVLHHPYDSYESVVKLLEEAAEDPSVVVIKQTLYRVSKDSRIMKALIKAAENGKIVTAVMEAKARFDEANNLTWGSRLEEAGGIVLYGLKNLKIHGKMCLIIKKGKSGKLKKLCHIGTGNYNEKNACIYTDLSILTSKEAIVKDVENLFNEITSSSKNKFKELLVSPINLKNNIIRLIDNEIEFAKHEKKARIVIKVNHITDPEICDKIYEACSKGVKIMVICRTSCSLKPMKNLYIKSIVGRFLEHSRMFYFYNGGKSLIYAGSCDLMERNLHKRIEILVPIHSLSSKAEDTVKKIIKQYIDDESMYSFELLGYQFRRGVNENHCQDDFMKKANKNRHKITLYKM